MAGTGAKRKHSRLTPRIQSGPITYSGSGFHNPRKYGKKDRREAKKKITESREQ